MPLLLTFFLALSLPAHAASGWDIYTYLYAGKTIRAKIGQSKGVRVNDICLKSEKGCEALKAFSAPSRIGEIHGSKNVNFPGAYCELLGGAPSSI